MNRTYAVVMLVLVIAIVAVTSAVQVPATGRLRTAWVALAASQVTQGVLGALAYAVGDEPTELQTIAMILTMTAFVFTLSMCPRRPGTAG